MSRFSVAVLTYGNYLGLFQRWYRSISEHLLGKDVVDVHLCGNAAGAETLDCMKSASALLRRRGLRVFMHTAAANAGKYPMMRWILHGPHPACGDYFMWFDDDSMVKDETINVFEPVRKLLQAGSPVVARRQGILLTRTQAEWLKTQPWAQKDSPWQSRYIQFPSGGWWAANREFLVSNNWPIPQLYHRGGDVMLGVLLQARGLTMVEPEPLPVWNNSQAPGQHNTQARRGIDHKPLGTVLPVPEVPVVPIETVEVL